MRWADVSRAGVAVADAAEANPEEGAGVHGGGPGIISGGGWRTGTWGGCASGPGDPHSAAAAAAGFWPLSVRLLGLRW